MAFTSSVVNAFKHGDNISNEGNHGRHIVVRWFAPQNGWVKLNVDDAFSLATNRAAYDGVVRDHMGSFIFAFTKGLGNCSNLHATHSVSTLLSNIRSLLLPDGQYVWRHIFQEGNSVADALAKHDLSLNLRFRLFDVISDFCVLPFTFDVAFTVYRRGM
ncbi:PREDICTED: uncharacterized protein LOC109361820 [Lupinus angustifolius]|uniref:uncharacterized protein LOC109361820 n=1 Tax=Lupinus angustifolius TaxID=3871 RepID=UPI00092E2205|nr:PREDICTED: uncharacterized protein LOC109361820 [Lupinus angustifolius]